MIRHFFDLNKDMDIEKPVGDSMTDSSSYEDINDMIPRILRGAVYPSVPSSYEFGENDSISDEVMDSYEDDDDLTVLDRARDVIAKAKENKITKENKASQSDTTQADTLDSKATTQPVESKA